MVPLADKLDGCRYSSLWCHLCNRHDHCRVILLDEPDSRSHHLFFHQDLEN